MSDYFLFKRYFFIVCFILVLFFCAFGVDIKTELEKLYQSETDFSVKKHIKLALQYYEKGFKKSFDEEIQIIKQLKKEYINIFESAEESNNVKNDGINSITVDINNNLLINKFEKVNKYYKESKLSNAQIELQDILSIDKENKTAGKMLQDIKEEEFIFDDSKPFQNLVKELYDKGMVFYRKKLYKEAIEKFEKALDLDPSNQQVKKFLNLSRENLLNIKEKEDEARLLEEADKLRTEGEIKKARSIYEKIYIYNRNNKQAEFYLNEFDRISNELYENAILLKKDEKLKEAYEKIKESLEFNEKNINAKNLEKELKMQLALYNENEKLRKKANQLYNKGVSCFAKGDYENACKYWEEVLKINPDDEQARKNIEIARAKLEEVELTKEEKIKKLIAEAETFINQGLLEKAKSKYEYVLRLDNENTEAKNGLKKIEKLNTIKIGEKIDKR